MKQNAFKESKQNKQIVQFNTEAVKSVMKQMQIQANLTNQDINNSNNTNNTSYKNMSTMDKYNSNREALTTLNEVEQKLLDQQNFLLKELMEENSDTSKLIEYYQKQIDDELKIHEQIKEEEIKNKLLAEMQINADKLELSENTTKLNQIKSECMELEAEFIEREVK